MMSFSFMLLLLLLTMGAGMADAGKIIYASSQTKAVVCPDEKVQCPDDSTCCQLTSGQWGCCPYAQAQCCPDKIHCCPQDYSCDDDRELCVHAMSNKMMAWAKKVPASVRSEEAASPENVICPDGTTCPGSSSSCCRTLLGSYSCCIYPYSVCCPTGRRCCLIGHICDSYSLHCLPYTTPGYGSTAIAGNEEWAIIQEAN